MSASRCHPHNNPIRYICLLQNCTNPPAMCVRCIQQVHGHTVYKNLQIDHLSKIINTAPSDNQYEYLKNQFSKYCKLMTQNFNSKIIQLNKALNIYIDNFDIMHYERVNSTLSDTITKVKNNRFQALSKNQIIDFMRLREFRYKPQQKIEQFKKYLKKLRQQCNQLDQLMQKVFKASIFQSFKVLKVDKIDSFKVRMFLSQEVALAQRNQKDQIFNISQSKRLSKQAAKLQKSKQYNKALLLYNKAIDVNPKSLTAYNNRGIVLKHMGMFQQAIRSFNIAIQIDPDWTTAIVNKGNCYRIIQNYQVALNLYDKVLIRQPKNFNALYNKALSLSSCNRYSQAITVLYRYKLIKPDDQDALLLQGICQAAIKQYDNAIKLYSQCIKINPNSHQAFFNKYLAFQKQGKSDLALRSIQQACAIEPKDKQYQKRRVNILQEMGKFNEAKYLK